MWIFPSKKMKSATLFAHAYANINHINTGDLLYVFHGSAGKPSKLKTSAELNVTTFLRTAVHACSM